VRHVHLFAGRTVEWEKELDYAHTNKTTPDKTTPTKPHTRPAPMLVIATANTGTTTLLHKGHLA